MHKNEEDLAVKLFEILKLKQGFNSFDLISMVASITAVAAISGPIIYRSVQSEKLEIAKQEMKKMARESVSSMLSGSSSRGISSLQETSASQIQKDPWGVPYHREILKNAYGQATHLVVWSEGPNKVVDTTAILPTNKSGVTAVIFQGDDMGIVLPLR